MSDERIVGTTEGIFKTRTTQRVPKDERWTQEASGLVGGVPWLLNGKDEKADGEPLIREPLRPLSEELLKETEVRAPVPRRLNMLSLIHI